MVFSLRFYIPAMLFLSLSLMGTIAVYGSYVNALENVRASSLEQLRNIGNLLSANVEAGIRYDQVSLVRSAIEQSQSYRYMKYSLLLNRDKQIFSSNFRQLEGRSLFAISEPEIVEFLEQLGPTALIDVIPGHPRYLVYHIPLRKQRKTHATGTLVDSMVLVADISPLIARARSDILVQETTWFVYFLAVALVVWFVLQKKVVREVEHLIDLTRQIKRGEQPQGSSPGLMTEFESLDSAMRSMASDLLDLQRNYFEIYEKNPATFLTIDRELNLININEYGSRVTQYRKSEIVGRPASILYFPEDRALFERYIAEIFAGDTTRHWELRQVTRDGKIIWVRDGARKIFVQDKEIVLLVSQDISDLHRVSQQLSYQATHDDLTGLINRAEFGRLLDNSLEKAIVTETAHSVCFLDLDQFKIINDTCGHIAGDELLRQISTTLKSNLKRGDILARIGGDEFGLLLESCPVDKAFELVDDLRQMLCRNRFVWKGNLFDVTVSGGISAIDSSNRNIQTVLSEADSACYTAKDRGRNQIVVFDRQLGSSQQLLDEMNWVNRIVKAIDQSEFELYFQRIHPLNIDDKDAFRGEILIRLREQDGSLIAPGSFLPAAERYNLAHKVDFWVTSATLDCLEKYQHRLPADWSISINLSASSFSSGEHIETLLELLSARPSFCPHLCFEITETSTMSNLAHAVDSMRALKALGCKLALDDFGSGFSSFGYLKQFPVNFLKIDGVFIRNIDDNQEDRAIVNSISQISRAFGKQTIAEFVENQESVDALRQLKVDFGQGYFFHRPEPFTAVLELLATPARNTASNI